MKTKVSKHETIWNCPSKFEPQQWLLMTSKSKPMSHCLSESQSWCLWYTTSSSLFCGVKTSANVTAIPSTLQSRQFILLVICNNRRQTGPFPWLENNSNNFNLTQQRWSILNSNQWTSKRSITNSNDESLNVNPVPPPYLTVDGILN